MVAVSLPRVRMNSQVKSYKNTFKRFWSLSGTRNKAFFILTTMLFFSGTLSTGNVLMMFAGFKILDHALNLSKRGKITQSIANMLEKNDKNWERFDAAREQIIDQEPVAESPTKKALTLAGLGCLFTMDVATTISQVLTNGGLANTESASLFPIALAAYIYGRNNKTIKSERMNSTLNHELYMQGIDIYDFDE